MTKLRSCIVLLAGSLIFGAAEAAQSPIPLDANGEPLPISKIHPAPGTTLTRFEVVEEGVYHGSKPHTDADFEFLQSKGIKYIIELHYFPWIYKIEQHRARRYGITLIPITLAAWTFTPNEQRVNKVLCMMHDKKYHPIYIHCSLGRDRAMLIVGLYDMYFRGMSKEEAWQHMKHYEFKESWTLRGLKGYFNTHSTQPVSRFVPDCASPELKPKQVADAAGTPESCGAH